MPDRPLPETRRTTTDGLTVVGHVTSAAPSKVPPPHQDAPRSETAAPAAPAVVLVHGLGSSARAYRHLVGPLSQDAEVHAVDLPGFGASPRPRRDVTVAAHAAALAAYLRQHVGGRPRPVVVGHSMGAQVVGQLLADHPDAVGAGVLLGPTSDPRARTLPQQALRLGLDALGEAPGAVGNLLVDTLVRSGPPYYVAQLRHVVEHHLEQVLPRVEVPVVVVRGDRDPVAPSSWTALLAASAPRGISRTVRGRHHAMDQDPWGLAAVVREAARLARQEVP
ncbi:alpha/beta hydrolase [Xylanimonas oleitrophica]|uniref:Alpha/beta hydrolase n=1 Tax=Xylanimonas oleitrophica TaxID=2607479 RepID=A0A2W5X0Y2_9MICO|nr:alpha/beta hydrolase family protein [Xylanimonas oleitrophica]PZR53875.1 alpha/beta hydrolase [Xylanimonas oleitrophica]